MSRHHEKRLREAHHAATRREIEGRSCQLEVARLVAEVRTRMRAKALLEEIIKSERRKA